MTRRVMPGPVPGDIESALDELGIVYTVRDNEATAVCPNPDHHDRKPSWSCNLDTGQHNCFSCGFGGSFVHLVAVVRGVARVDATRWVRKRGGVERGRVMVDGTERATRPARQFSASDLALFDLPPAEAMDKRGISQEAVKNYGVLWDTAKDCWIIPVRDPHTFKLRGWQEKGSDYFKNVPYGLEKADCLFGLEYLRPGGRAILVESPLDCLRIWEAGFLGAVSSYGAQVSEEQLGVLKQRCGVLVCALDDDNAGWKRAAWIKEHWRGQLKYFDYFAAWNWNTSNKQGRKDPGEMNDEEIRRGVKHAYSSLIARF